MGSPFKGVDRGSIPRGHTKTSLESKMTNPTMNDEDKLVVRLRTTCWYDKNGLYYKRSLTFLRRKSGGLNVLEQDASDNGAESVIPRIVNLNECADGIYQVETCNESTDWETGHVDSYDYMLLKHE